MVLACPVVYLGPLWKKIGLGYIAATTVQDSKTHPGGITAQDGPLTWQPSAWPFQEGEWDRQLRGSEVHPGATGHKMGHSHSNHQRGLSKREDKTAVILAPADAHHHFKHHSVPGLHEEAGAPGVNHREQASTLDKIQHRPTMREMAQTRMAKLVLQTQGSCRKSPTQRHFA